MTDDTDMILRSMRMQAWERAKGELRACLSTFFGEEERHRKLDDAVNEFVKRIDDEGLAE
jgi:hypothetical protein